MKTSKKGIELLQKFEGCVLKAYKLAGESFYTIGYGHSFDKNVTEGTAWTKEKAVEVLTNDLKRFEGYVGECTKEKKICLSQNQFDALVSYTYNRGKGGLKQLFDSSSSVKEIGDNLTVYWGSAEKYKDALVARRKKEQMLFFM